MKTYSHPGPAHQRTRPQTGRDGPMEPSRQESASAAMSEGSARRCPRAGLPSERKKAGRSWGTRRDPFMDVWENDGLPLLQSDPEGELRRQLS